MKKAKVKLRGLTPLTFGKFHQTPKLNKELADAHEERTWREKAHFSNNDYVKIPGIMIENAIRESARFLSIQVPGKGKSTYTKHFDAGVISDNDIETDIKKDALKSTAVHVPSDGRAGGTKRVIKIFPIVHEWEGQLDFTITDDIITPDVFERVIRNAGNLIGIGTWRPRNRGKNGKFEVVDIEWSEEEI